jgi:thioredoxin reductase
MHGFLSREGVRPASLRAIGRRDLADYDVEIREEEVLDVRRKARSGFRVHLAGGRAADARKLLLATGVVDRIPSIPGIEALYGVSVHHCPYCDGWEWRDRRLAVHGRTKGGIALAHSLKTWSQDVVFLTDGPARVAPSDQAELRARGIELVRNRILGLEGTGGMLRRVLFRGREPLERDALFFSTRNDQSCGLAAGLGCRTTLKAAIRTNRRGGTNIPGVYVAGDASWDVQFVVVAAAEGAKAGVAINRELQSEERAATV